MALPDYIDNNQHTLEEVLRSLILQETQTHLDIATGFFRIEAWVRLEQELNNLTSLRLLIGRDPTIRPAESDRIDLIRYFRREFLHQLETEKFKREYKQQIDRLIAYLQQEHIQIRLYGAVGDPITLVLEGNFNQCQTDFRDMAQARQLDKSLLLSFGEFEGRVGITKALLEHRAKRLK